MKKSENIMKNVLCDLYNKWRHNKNRWTFKHVIINKENRFLFNFGFSVSSDSL